jgi:hypothetical protein
MIKIIYQLVFCTILNLPFILYNNSEKIYAEEIENHKDTIKVNSSSLPSFIIFHKNLANHMNVEEENTPKNIEVSHKKFLLENTYSQINPNVQNAIAPDPDLYFPRTTPGYLPAIDENGKVYKKVVLSMGTGKGKSPRGTSNMGLSYFVTPDVNLKTGPVFIKDPHFLGETKWGLQFSLNIPIQTKGE